MTNLAGSPILSAVNPRLPFVLLFAGGVLAAADCGGGGGAVAGATSVGGAGGESSVRASSGGDAGHSSSTGSHASAGSGGRTATGGSGGTGGTGGKAPTCGDGVCEPGESCANCLADCRPAPTLAAVNPRGSDSPSFVNGSTYNYSPSVMLDGDYRMWWCCGGSPPGDHICYAEAASLDGPWHAHSSMQANTFDYVFEGTQNAADFDGVDVCDPSVVRVDGTYYMYYGAIPDYLDPGVPTRIGVATSPDGLSWSRLNGGKAIIDFDRDPVVNNLPNKYGAGQPSATFVDGIFYVVFTDTTGIASNPVNGAGQYIMRSSDPTFQTGVEELTATGFVPAGQSPHTGYSILETYGSDLQYVDALDMFVLANSGTFADGVALHFYDAKLKPEGSPLKIPGAWTEEPALASRPDKHAVPWGGDCGTLAFDVMRSVGGPQPATWNLAHAGVDVTTGLSCACVPLGRMLEGTLLAVPTTPLTLVRGGERLQFALAPPALRLARTQVNPGIDVFNAIPYGASVHSGAEAIQAPAQPGAYLLDDGKLWPVSCAGELTDNNSTLTMVDAATYGSYGIAYPLYCLQ